VEVKSGKDTLVWKHINTQSGVPAFAPVEEISRTVKNKNVAISTLT
jgi:hypothetical protein